MATRQKEQKLQAQLREGTGKGVARKLRQSGRVPAVLYGHGNDAVALSVDSRDLYHLLHTGAGSNVLVDVVVDGTDHLAMPREIQRDAIRGSFWHVDFLEVSRDETIAVDVPIHVVGESVGVKQGGVLEHHLWDLHVECLPGDVPEGIEVDISALEVGDSLKVSDLVVPSGVSVLTGADESVLAVVVPQAREVEEAEEAAAAEAAEAAEGEGGEAGAEAAEGEGSSEEGGES
jgi:large subunit ribosomal protein L25